jgi:hypothetical protein
MLFSRECLHSFTNLTPISTHFSFERRLTLLRIKPNLAFYIVKSMSTWQSPQDRFSMVSNLPSLKIWPYLKGYVILPRLRNINMLLDTFLNIFSRDPTLWPICSTHLSYSLVGVSYSPNRESSFVLCLCVVSTYNTFFSSFYFTFLPHYNLISHWSPL